MKSQALAIRVDQKTQTGVVRVVGQNPSQNRLVPTQPCSRFWNGVVGHFAFRFYKISSTYNSYSRHFVGFNPLHVVRHSQARAHRYP
jgi:hypothetical protein